MTQQDNKTPDQDKSKDSSKFPADKNKKDDKQSSSKIPK